MVFTPKLITLIVSGAVALFFILLTASLDLSRALAFLLIYNAAIAALVAADWVLTVKPQSLRVSRIYEHRLSLGADNPVTLQLENVSRIDMKVIVKDEPPVSFKASAVFQTAKLPAGAVFRLKYTLEPPKRGDYSFGNINIRYHSRLGFFLRQFKVTAENNHIRVYPNIKEIRKYQLLARQGHLIEAGLKPSKVVGLGTDFESVRDYQVDDEYRRINWGATARRGRLVSNQYEVDRSQNILLVLDTGRMMSGEVNSLTKLDHAINTSLLLGHVGVNWDDKVGLVAFADRVKVYIPPRKGRPQLQRIMAGLYNIQSEVVESDYQAMCRYISYKNRKRSLICIFTDLIDEEASNKLITYVSSLTGTHLVMCITMLDTFLLAQAKKVPVNSQEVYEKGVAQTVLATREKAVLMLKNRGVSVVDVPADKLSVATINKYIELKSLAKL